MSVPGQVIRTEQGVRFREAAYAATLDDWVSALVDVYKVHEPLYYRLSDYWMHATNAAQNVSEEVRRGRPVELVRKLGTAFAWCCTTAWHVLEQMKRLENQSDKLDAGDTWAHWLAYKYPGRCHYCGWPSCRCPAQRQVVEERNDEQHPLRDEIRQQFDKIRNERPKLSLQDVQKYQKKFVTMSLANQIREFDKIYQAANFERPLENICFHYLEEVGEVAREISWFEALGRIQETAALRDKYKQQFKDILNGNDISLDIEKWAKGALTVADTGIEVANRIIGNLKDMEFDAQIRRLQYAYTLAIMAEMTDVFSWATAIDYKVRQACDRVGAKTIDLASYLCGSLAGERKSYVIKVGSDDYAQCAYCGSRFCDERCVAGRLLFEALKKRIKQELS